MELRLQNCILAIFSHVVTLTFGLWTSNFQKCLTLPQYVFLNNKSSYLMYLNGVAAPNCILAHIWSCGDLASTKHWFLYFFDCKKSLTGTLKWSYGCKTVLLTIFGPVVTLTFYPWTSNFQKCLTLAQYVLFWQKLAPLWCIWMELWIQNNTFANIWSCGDLDLWT